MRERNIYYKGMNLVIKYSKATIVNGKSSKEVMLFTYRVYTNPYSGRFVSKEYLKEQL